MGEKIKIQFICHVCTARLIIWCDQSIWTRPRYCEGCQSRRVFLRDVILSNSEFDELIPVEQELLYIFRAGKRFKIGASRDPRRRLQDFSTSPIPVEFVWASHVENARAMEKALQALFHAQRIHGEWFELSEANIKFIKKLGAQHER